MASIFDEYELTKEKFETVVGVGMTMPQVLTIFRKSLKEMDEWCEVEYGIPSVRTVYEAVRQMALSEFLSTVRILGDRGNSSALNIINTALQNLQSSQTVKIVFDNNLPEENEEDKEDDE